MRAFGQLALFAATVGGVILGALLVMAWMSGVPTVREHSGWFLISILLLLASIQIGLTGHPGRDPRARPLRHGGPPRLRRAARVAGGGADRPDVRPRRAVRGDGPAPHRALWGDLVNHVRHRGPDAGSFWADGPFFLGHRRLAILGLESGHQPMATEDGSLVVVLNGEIYNFIELRAELEQIGYRFRTDSDTEVLLHGYRAWGEDLPGRLTGQFAFALADRRRRHAVPRARPLRREAACSCCALRGYVAFASELRPLAALPDLDRRLDVSALGGYLSLNYVPGEATLLAGVRRLPPATWVVFTPEGERVAAVLVAAGRSGGDAAHDGRGAGGLAAALRPCRAAGDAGRRARGHPALRGDGLVAGRGVGGASGPPRAARSSSISRTADGASARRRRRWPVASGLRLGVRDPHQQVARGLPDSSRTPTTPSPIRPRSPSGRSRGTRRGRTRSSSAETGETSCSAGISPTGPAVSTDGRRAASRRRLRSGLAVGRTAPPDARRQGFSFRARAPIPARRRPAAGRGPFHLERHLAPRGGGAPCVRGGPERELVRERSPRWRRAAALGGAASMPPAPARGRRGVPSERHTGQGRPDGHGARTGDARAVPRSRARDVDASPAGAAGRRGRAASSSRSCARRRGGSSGRPSPTVRNRASASPSTPGSAGPSRATVRDLLAPASVERLGLLDSARGGRGPRRPPRRPTASRLRDLGPGRAGGLAPHAGGATARIRRRASEPPVERTFPPVALTRRDDDLVTAG